VNFILESGETKPMATIWMNRVQPSLKKSADVFQTWNPIIEPQADKLLAEAKVERPVVTTESVKAIEELRELRHRKSSRLWVTGSYAQWGIPLLEAAVVSAIEVSQSFGVEQPWN
jgi:predicted NAD/FAD-binding protein